MTFYASILLAVAATLGLVMVILGVRYHRSSFKLAMSHAAIAIGGLGFLGTKIINGPINKYNNVAALLLVLALIGGGMLFALREKDQPPAMMMVVIHASMALAGLVVLFLGL
jgi:hypothetical protein